MNGELTAGSRMTLAPWRRARAVTAARSAVWMSGLVGAKLQLHVGPGVVRWAMVVMVAVSGAALLM